MSENPKSVKHSVIALKTGTSVESQPLLTVEDVARRLKLKPKQVYNLKIPCIRVSRRAMRFDPDTFEAWLQARAS